MTIPWMLTLVISKLEAVIYFSCQFFTFKKINSDYDTHETVTCSSFFIYDLERQRNLQHFIKIEELPTEFRILKLPSGEFHFVTAATLPDKERAFKNLLSWLDLRKEIKL